MLKRVLRYLGISCGVIAAALLVIEVGLRASGVTEYPVYQRAPGVLYFQAPNQHGAFLHKNRWYVDDQGFDNAERYAVSHPNCLLVGDSVVYGGNPFDHANRVGTLAAARWGHPIWVAAAGGWNLLNELAFLKMHHAELASADKLVFVLNNGDFGKPGTWSDVPFPTHKPVFASWYAFRRYVLPHLSDLPQIVSDRDTNAEKAWIADLDSILKIYKGRVTVILYPDQSDLRDAAAWTAHTTTFRTYARSHADRIDVINLRTDSTWNPSKYRDPIHPNADGNKFLSDITAHACETNRAAI
jgi:hypothetical protein